eukprot:1612930-Rhodomonas_salina.2
MGEFACVTCNCCARTDARGMLVQMGAMDPLPVSIGYHGAQHTVLRTCYAVPGRGVYDLLPEADGTERQQPHVDFAADRKPQDARPHAA